MNDLLQMHNAPEYHDICIRGGASLGFKTGNYSDRLCVGVGPRMANVGQVFVTKISMNQE